MADHPLVDKAILPNIRWSILRTVGVGGHLGVTEKMIHDVLAAEYRSVSESTMRDQLDYLKKRDLIEIELSEVRPWGVTLTRWGHDVVDYQVPCDPGIARPPRLSPQG